jgi:hypothetical protein
MPMYVPTTLLVFPSKEPLDNLLYGVSMAQIMLDMSDTIVAANVSARPSGDGELTVANVSVSNEVVTFWLSSGVPGRTYVVSVVVTCATGSIFQELVTLPMDATLAARPLPVPPSTDFGTPIIWPVPEIDEELMGDDGELLLGDDGQQLTGLSPIYPAPPPVAQPLVPITLLA